MAATSTATLLTCVAPLCVAMDCAFPPMMVIGANAKKDTITTKTLSLVMVSYLPFLTVRPSLHVDAT